MHLIDTHCHLHDPEFFSPSEQDDFLATAHAAHVDEIIVIGTNPDDSAVARDFALSHDEAYWTYGIHPEFANHHNVTEVALNDADHLSKLVAIGEIGLDYHYAGYDRAAQLRLFEQMLQLAIDLSLPVSLHIREAFDDAWSVLNNFPGLTGVVHSFTGNKKQLTYALARGFFIGVNGLATYNTLPLPPLEKTLLETDAPFLTPNPLRGKINQPAYVSLVATYLAEKMGVAEVNLAEHTTNNAKQLFHLQ